MNELVSDFRARKTHFTEQTGLGTGPVSTEPYRSPEYFELERERVFKRAWLCMAREERLPNPGDFIVENIEVANASILITRGKDGVVRAFHNVCSHRSNTVVLEREGTASRFVCRYHNWTYRNDGQLAGVPDEANFFGMDKKCHGLTPVACDVWEGWVFINLQREPEVSLAEFLGDFGEKYRGIPYPNADKSILYVSHLNVNWKVIADAFAETYHVPAIHPETIGSTFASKDNPFAMAENGPEGLFQRVHPMLVPMAHPLAHVDGALNAVVADGNFVGSLFFQGKGAGDGPTASAVVADLIDVARDEYGDPFAMPIASLAHQPKADAGRRSGRAYLRFSVQDKPGVLAEIAAAMRDAGVSIESLIQRGANADGSVLVAIVTHEGPEACIADTLRRLSGSRSLVGEPMVMHILA